MSAGGVARFTLGAAGLGNLFEAMDDAQAQETLQAAWDLGVRRFDTAPHYGLGLSERRVGAFLQGQAVGEYTVSTKAGRLLADNSAARRPDGSYPSDEDMFDVPARTHRVWDFSAAGIRQSLTESLERLGIPQVDTLYLHDPDESPDPERGMADGLAALEELRSEGLVRRIGVGSKSTPTLVAAARTGIPTELMVAGRLTLLDDSATHELLPLCAQHGIGVAAAAVFSSGLLATPDPAGPYEYAEAPAQIVEQARRIAAVCTEHGTDLPTAALHHPLRFPVVTSVVAGARTAEQVRTNVTRMDTPPPAALWDDLVQRGLVPAAP